MCATLADPVLLMWPVPRQVALCLCSTSSLHPHPPQVAPSIPGRPAETFFSQGRGTGEQITGTTPPVMLTVANKRHILLFQPSMRPGERGNAISPRSAAAIAEIGAGPVVQAVAASTRYSQGLCAAFVAPLAAQWQNPAHQKGSAQLARQRGMWCPVQATGPYCCVPVEVPAVMLQQVPAPLAWNVQCDTSQPGTLFACTSSSSVCPPSLKPWTSSGSLVTQSKARHTCKQVPTCAPHSSVCSACLVWCLCLWPHTESARACLYNTCRDNNITTAALPGLAPAVETGPSQVTTTLLLLSDRPTKRPHTRSQNNSTATPAHTNCNAWPAGQRHRHAQNKKTPASTQGRARTAGPQHTPAHPAPVVCMAAAVSCRRGSRDSCCCCSNHHHTARLVQGRERIPPPLPLPLLTKPPAAYSLSCRRGAQRQSSTAVDAHTTHASASCTQMPPTLLYPAYAPHFLRPLTPPPYTHIHTQKGASHHIPCAQNPKTPAHPNTTTTTPTPSSLSPRTR